MGMSLCIRPACVCACNWWILLVYYCVHVFFFWVSNFFLWIFCWAISVLFSPSAVELAMIMDRLYGGVCYAGIDTDPELKYPKGAGRVAFSNQQSYIAAISARFVQLQHGEIDKRVSAKNSVFLCLPFFLHLSFTSLPLLFLSNSPCLCTISLSCTKERRTSFL